MKTGAKVALLGMFMAVPSSIVLWYSLHTGLPSLLFFGEIFRSNWPPQLQAVSPPVTSEGGYDGQMYVQVALNPTLAEAKFTKSLDNPLYRARRIGLPLTAYLLGRGHAASILRAYAVLNVIFWLLLLGVLYRSVGLNTYRDVLLFMAILWSTGTLVSIERSLTDLPAAVITLWGAYLSGRAPIIGAVIVGAAGLYKETSILSAPCCWGAPRGRRNTVALTWILSIVPLLLWCLFVQHRLSRGGAVGAQGGLSLPFVAFGHKVAFAMQDLFHPVDTMPPFMRFMELLCPISLLAQCVYLVSRPQYGSRIWRMGIGFVPLFLCLGFGIFADQYNYCRAVLPLTVAFNLLVRDHERGRAYSVWMLLANGGMMWSFCRAFSWACQMLGTFFASLRLD
jgi:hypothetical protein